MNNTLNTRISASIAHWALSIALLLAAPLVLTQAMLAQAPSRFVGAITAIQGSTLTVKTDVGEVRQVDVPATSILKRIAPGQKDLSTAETISFGDLATGDRVLVKLDPDATGPVGQALQIIAIKQADVALKQQHDREDWQRRGLGGLVKSVDASANLVVLTSGTGAAAKTITVHIAKNTLLKRYAPASVSFDAAVAAPIDAIKAGDQLRARGTKNADGTDIAAEEVVSGSFRNVSGVLSSVDVATSTLSLKDLTTKKQVTVHITADAQMRRLPDRMALMLAARLKGGAGGAGNAQAAAPGAGGSARGGSGQWSGGATAGGAGQGGAQGMGQAGGGGQWGGQGGSVDPQQMLNRAPVIQLADLKKGDAVMIVSTDGTTEVTAITLVAGVEPLLEAPAASNLLSNWSMSAGSPEAAQ